MGDYLGSTGRERTKGDIFISTDVNNGMFRVLD